MEISKNIYLDNLIKENIFSYLPKNRFKEGVFYSPMNFYDYEINDMLVENYEFNIIKKTKNYVFLKIKLQPEDDEIKIKKKIKKDAEGEYIAFNDCKERESLIYLNTCIFFNSAFFRPKYLKTNIKDLNYN
jgi:hypothetical protein|tara:strand:- start:428 stop:820 length:393 start_codon:yes stop_codon:yes gene_type:complete